MTKNESNLIDSKEKAIELAKKDLDVKKYVEDWKKQDKEVEFHSEYRQNDSAWLVWCQPKHIITGPYEIYIKSDGSIIKKGYVAEG